MWTSYSPPKSPHSFFLRTCHCVQVEHRSLLPKNTTPLHSSTLGILPWFRPPLPSTWRFPLWDKPALPLHKPMLVSPPGLGKSSSPEQRVLAVLRGGGKYHSFFQKAPLAWETTGTEFLSPAAVHCIGKLCTSPPDVISWIPCTCNLGRGGSPGSRLYFPYIHYTKSTDEGSRGGWMPSEFLS